MTEPDNPSEANFKPPAAANYRVLSANSIHELERLVTTALKAGLRLYGNPFQYKDSICQAVTKG